MGLAVNTVIGQVTNSTALTGVSYATGDSGSVANFAPPATAYLESIFRQGGTAGQVQVLSTRLHDDVRGITYGTAESPAQFLLPPDAAQQLQSGDTLTVNATSGSANSTVAGLSLYYTNLPGASQRLHSWGDISGIIEYIKPVQVACTSSATIGAWADTVITTTENLLKANADYAVLGYITDAALAVVGVRGADTSSMRVCGPGASSSLDVSNYFVVMSNLSGRPHIPVIGSANMNNTYVSVAAATASVAANVYLVMAKLAQTLPS